jgi:hypothetical protein
MLKKKTKLPPNNCISSFKGKELKKFITSLKEIIIKMLGYTLIRKITNYFKIMEF